MCFFWCGVNNKNNITRIISDSKVEFPLELPFQISWEGLDDTCRKDNFLLPIAVHSWGHERHFPKKKISKQALYEMNWNEISINQAEKIQECMSLSNHHPVLTQCYLQLVPLELLIASFAGWKFRTWYVLRWSQMPRIGLMGAATFHWFDVACDRNARRKCSFATFGGVGGFGWFGWWNKGALVPNFSKFLAGWGPKSFKVKTSKPFFSFWTSSQPPRYLHPLAATRLYARHACLPSSRSKTWAVWRAQKTAFFIFSPLIPFSKFRISKWKYVLLGIEQSILFIFMFTTYGSLVRSDFKHWLPMPGIIQVRNALRKKPYHLRIPRHSKLAQPMGMV